MLVADLHTAAHNSTTSTGALLAGNIPFPATQWSLRNTGSVPVHLSLNSSVATTVGIEIAPGTTRAVPGYSAKFSITTTSTSTDGRDVRAVSVAAMGG